MRAVPISRSIKCMLVKTTEVIPLLILSVGKGVRLLLFAIFWFSWSPLRGNFDTPTQNGFDFILKLARTKRTDFLQVCPYRLNITGHQLLLKKLAISQVHMLLDSWLSSDIPATRPTTPWSFQ